MDRNEWLAERRAAVRAQYDAEAPDYTDDFYPVPLHAAFIERLLAGTPPGGVVLDAPCGTGRWFAQVAASGRRVIGVDQSAGMLAQARARGTAEALHEVAPKTVPVEATTTPRPDRAAEAPAESTPRPDRAAVAPAESTLRSGRADAVRAPTPRR